MSVLVSELLVLLCESPLRSVDLFPQTVKPRSTRRLHISQGGGRLCFMHFDILDFSRILKSCWDFRSTISDRERLLIGPVCSREGSSTTVSFPAWISNDINDAFMR